MLTIRFYADVNSKLESKITTQKSSFMLIELSRFMLIELLELKLWEVAHFCPRLTSTPAGVGVMKTPEVTESMKRKIFTPFIALESIPQLKYSAFQ